MLWLTKQDLEQGLSEVQAAILEAEKLAGHEDEWRLWRVGAAFCDALLVNAIAPDGTVRQLFPRLDMQLKQLAEGQPVNVEPLLRQMLYIVARALPLSDRITEIQEVLALKSCLPSADEEQARALDEAWLPELRAVLGQAKHDWSAYTAGDGAALARFHGHAEQSTELANRLSNAALSQLFAAIRQCVEVARLDAQDASRTTDRNLAALLLVLDQATQDDAHRVADFYRLAHRLIEQLNHGRCEADAVLDLHNVINIQAHERDLIVHVGGEVRHSLRTAKEVVDQFARNRTGVETLPALVPALKHTALVLTTLDMLGPARLLEAVSASIYKIAGPDLAAPPLEIERLAEQLSAVEMYLENIAIDPERTTEFLNAALARFGLHTTPAEVGASTLEDEPGRSALELVEHEPTSVAATSPAPAVPAKGADSVDASTLDREMIEIFLEEATEVLRDVGEGHAQCIRDPRNTEALITVRRGFHTLKGSGRMVGLPALAEVAWAIEETLNYWLEEQRPADGALLDCVQKAQFAFQRWVHEIKETLHTELDAAALIAEAEQLRSVEPVEAVLLQPIATPVVPVVDPAVPETSESTVPVLEPVNDLVTIDRITLSKALYQIFIQETEAHMATLEREPPMWLGHTREPSHAFLRASHTLAGIARNTGFLAVADLAFALERWCEGVQDPPRHLAEAEISAVQAAIASLARMLQAIRAGQVAPAEPDLITALDAWINPPVAEITAIPATALDAAPDASESATRAAVEPDLITALDIRADQPAAADSESRPAAEMPVTPPGASYTSAIEPAPAAVERDLIAVLDAWIKQSDAADSEFQATAGVSATPDSISRTASGLPEPVTPATAEPDWRAPQSGECDPVTRDLGPEVLSMLIDEAQDLYSQICQSSRAWRQAPGDVRQRHRLQRALHTLKGSSSVAGLVRLGELVHLIEGRIEAAETPGVAFFDDLDEMIDRVGAYLDRMGNGVFDPLAGTSSAVNWATTQQDAQQDARFAPATPPSVTATGSDFTPTQPADSGESQPAAERSATPAAGSDTAPGAPKPATPAATEPGLRTTRIGERRKVIDDVDPEVLSLLIDEAQDLYLQIGQSSRAWRNAPEDESQRQRLQRALHTLKGSSRVAGLMRLGQLIHLIEGRIEAIETPGIGFFDELDDMIDRIGADLDRNANGMFDPLAVTVSAVHWRPHQQHAKADVAATGTFSKPPQQESADCTELPAQLQWSGVFSAPTQKGSDAAVTGLHSVPNTGLHAVRVVTASNTGTNTGQGSAAGQSAQAADDPAGRAQRYLRVSIEAISKLAEGAAEINVTRSRIEGELLGSKHSLNELTEGVDRLRNQLREMEIQAESQIQAQQVLVSDLAMDFDPLEFDRFTRIQELTRFMNESVHDVAIVQQALLQRVDSTEAMLRQQGRSNRELQDGLMKLRMVPLATIAERLYRTVRQAGKTLKKKAYLEITGANVEMDRGAMERMVAPFEHLLRNAIAHGLEDAETRRRLGKGEHGSITLHAVQDGNQVHFSISDDGRGLELERVRMKADEQGIIPRGAKVADDELMQVIFTPGFTTMREVTEIAGRGVGLDVVKSEITALGGLIDVESVPGKGVTFHIYLPVSLALTKAVLARVGSSCYAIPSVLIEEVYRIQADELVRLYEFGALERLGQRYGFHYFSRLLGDTDQPGHVERHGLVVALRSGPERMALHVDGLLGNRELVIKPLGTQLARVPWLIGGTVLADGQVILIVDPTRVPHHMVQGTSRETQVERTVLPLVMVVDDSLTVRKITSRFLEREGYRVVTAKDGLDALEQMQERVPDVVVVDIEMPRMDGLEMTKRIRASGEWSHLPIIMITSRTADKHRAYARQVGVDAYLVKPYKEDELMEHIVRLLDTSAAGQGLSRLAATLLR
ncbi:MAG: Hpt domain-containing protein [Gammaproteobacteria bacterium]